VDVELGARRYRELLELGIGIGVKPACEYLGFAEEFNTIEKAVDLITRCGHPEATIVHDPFHVFRGGGSFESVGTLNPEQIAVFHFNDAPDFPPRELQHDPDRVMPGDGCLDLKGVLRSLNRIGYTGWISLELFNRDWWKRDPRETAKVGLERMRELAAEES
jgi:sugar phosphate isomerase/epimerase